MSVFFTTTSTTASCINVHMQQTSALTVYNGIGNTTLYTGTGQVINSFDNSINGFDQLQKHLKLNSGTARVIELPDGTKINVDADGNFSIDDKDSKVVYKASRLREFNKYMNASDLIEDFIRDVGKLGVTQGQLLKIPINALFVWLVAKAAEADGEVPPEDVPKLEMLPEVRNNLLPKCKCCGRFLSLQKHRLGINFCNSDHMDAHMNKHLVRA